MSVSQELEVVANQFREEARNREKYPGTGYHVDDRNPTKPDIYLAQQRRPTEGSSVKFFCKASENVTAFTGEFDVVFIGEDSEKVLKTLKEWAEETSRSNPEDITLKQRKMLKYISRISLTTKDEIPRLILRKALWADYIHILSLQGQGVFGYPLPNSEEMP